MNQKSTLFYRPGGSALTPRADSPGEFEAIRGSRKGASGESVEWGKP